MTIEPIAVPERYGPISQALHWVMAVLVLAAFLYGPGGNEQRVYSAARDFDRQLHETLGICVFLLAFARVVWRSLAPQPLLPQGPRWMELAAKSLQGALYLLLFAVPLTAIAGAWLEGHPLGFLGGLQVAPLLPLAHDLGSQVASVHTWLGDTLMWLAGLHALAAIFHHVVLKDAVLLSMLPRWTRLPQRT